MKSVLHLVVLAQVQTYRQLNISLITLPVPAGTPRQVKASERDNKDSKVKLKDPQHSSPAIIFLH